MLFLLQDEGEIPGAQFSQSEMDLLRLGSVEEENLEHCRKLNLTMTYLLEDVGHPFSLRRVHT